MEKIITYDDDFSIIENAVHKLLVYCGATMERS